MKIVHIPHNILHKKTKNVLKVNESLIHTIQEMKRVMELEKDPEGVGLSANQVGLPYSLFIMRPSINAPCTVCINPNIIKIEGQILPKAGKRTKKRKKIGRTKLEGCLSIPGVWGYVKRYPKILLEYTDMKGMRKKKWFTGFKAVIVQHEMDHLNGVLFTQRVIEQGEELYKEIEGEFIPYRI